MMFATLLNDLSPALLASADSDGGDLTWLLALGPAGAGGVYFGLWRYYRNTQRSHDFERETRIEAQPVTGNDAKVGENNGTQQSSIKGDNHSNHRQRVQRVNEH